MSPEIETAAGETGGGRCWRCGRVTSEEALVRLGSHPEVGVCINCVRFLGRREGLPGDGSAQAAERRGCVDPRGGHGAPLARAPGHRAGAAVG
jgi:hypothetical protein